MKKISIAFLGNSEISTYALKSLLNDMVEIKIVITGQDKNVGRSHTDLQENPVAKFSKTNNLPLFKTDSINQDLSKVLDIEVDYIITCSFGQILSDEVLAWPKVMPINIHTSLLPKGRGGAPIHWALIKGETITGYSIMKMNSKMDAGEIFYQEKLSIENDDTYDSLYLKFSNLISETFLENFINYVIKNPNPTIQNEAQIEFWLNIKKEDRFINWNRPAIEIINQVRGLNSKPGAYALYNDLEIKILEAKINDRNFPMVKKLFRPGEIVAILDDAIVVNVKNNQLILITQLIYPGKKQIPLRDFLNGNRELFKPFTRFLIQN